MYSNYIAHFTSTQKLLYDILLVIALQYNTEGVGAERHFLPKFKQHRIQPTCGRITVPTYNAGKDFVPRYKLLQRYVLIE